jgi:hypothetical protein
VILPIPLTSDFGPIEYLSPFVNIALEPIFSHNTYVTHVSPAIKKVLLESLLKTQRKMGSGSEKNRFGLMG